MTTTSTLRSSARTASHDVLSPRGRHAVSYCDIWDLVAPGEPCPTCEVTFEDRLARARNGDR